MKHFAYLNRAYMQKCGLIVALMLVSTLVVLSCGTILQLLLHTNAKSYSNQVNDKKVEEITLPFNYPLAQPRQENCTHEECFNIYKCGRAGQTKISVYVYPRVKYLDDQGIRIFNSMSKEFDELLKAIETSVFAVDNARDACLFVPAVDFLNQNRIRLKESSQVLKSLSLWNGGENHLIFNLIPGTVPEFSTVLEVNAGKSMIAGGGFSTWTHRKGFDISLPPYSPSSMSTHANSGKRKYLVVSAQVSVHNKFLRELEYLEREFSELVLLRQCSEGSNDNTRLCAGTQIYSYPHVLLEGTFCTVFRGARFFQTILFDSMQAGCIPVIFADGYVLPFSNILDWKRSSIIQYEEDLPDVMDILHQMSEESIDNMREQAKFFWKSYFSSMKVIVQTTLQIINDRVFPQSARSYDQWNQQNFVALSNPLFLPLVAPKSDGFTAVILTYDRVESLFEVITQVALAPSLAKVLVVWNNQNQSPPQAAAWPKISKPLKVVQTRANKLSNRFYPYEEIETEAILAMDDDIIMMTADELEFGYEVWREFPDRLVGFPSRVHLWETSNSSKSGRWKYESEWTNDISMVLTGAAFYHKYYSFLYTTSMPGDIKEWVDDNMNCEDIAMNFLIANLTGKPPIKVAPRKKFKCPKCTGVEMSADLSHMTERSECINRFAQVYSYMPLISVEFRADPVLYKSNLPNKLLRFRELGDL